MFPSHYIQDIFNTAFHQRCPVCHAQYHHPDANLQYVQPVSNGWLAVIKDKHTDNCYSVVIKPILSTFKTKDQLTFDDFLEGTQ